MNAPLFQTCPTPAVTAVPAPVADADSPLSAIAARVTAYLQQAAAQGLSTEHMRAELGVIQNELRRRHPGVRMNLVAHVEPYDQSVAHDVVVRDGDDVLVIGVAAGPGLPWPLRGVTRADEQRLLRVNGEKLDVPDALACLDVVFDDRQTLRTLVDSCLVAEALAEEPVRLTDQELQLAADAFRRAKGLLTPAQTYTWLEERAMSEAEFEDIVRRTAAVAALRRRVAPDGRVQEHFQEHAARYATVLVAWAAGTSIGPADEPLGAVIAARRAGRAAGVSEWRVGELPEEMAAVGDTEIGVPVPARVDGVDGTAVVIDRREADLDPATADLIARELFADWLATRRATADIEWHWGDAVRTGRAR